MKPFIFLTLKFHIVIILVISTSMVSIAQETTVNTQIGVSFRDNYKLTDNWKIYRSQTVFVSPELRFLTSEPSEEETSSSRENNFWENFYSLTSALLRYEFNKELKAGVGYQLHGRSSGVMYRFHTEVFWNKRMNPSWRLYNRFRYQKEWLKGSRSGEWYFRDHLRIRSRLQYRGIKYVRPYADAETTLRLNKDRRRFDRLRTAVGLDFRIDRHTLRIEYNYQIRPYREDIQPSTGLIIRGFFRI